MNRWLRILLALIVGLLAGMLSYHGLTERGYYASDFQWPLRAARALLSGENPYEVVVPVGPYPFDYHFFYPLHAGIVAIPFTGMDDYLAGAAFIGLSSALLAYVITRSEPWRLILFLSAPFYVSAYTAQLAPLVLCAAFSPALQFLSWCKPNVGLITYAYWPTRAGLLSAALGLLVSLIVLWEWPLWWYYIVSRIMPHHPSAMASIVGWLCLLAVLRWRRAGARALLVSTVVPQSLFWYDQLAIWLVPRTPRQMLFLTACSWLGYAAWWLHLGGQPDTGQYVPTASAFVLASLYLPALATVLWPNMRRNG